MKRQAQAPNPDRRDPRNRSAPYGRPQRRTGPFVAVMVHLQPDAAAAVQALVERHGLSRSGAAHHLVRLGAGLPPLHPLN